MRLRVSTISLLIILAGGVALFTRYGSATESQPAAIIPRALPITSTTPSLPRSTSSLIEPVEEFLSRATVKHYGTYITPDSSPIKGDRFTGYHTGVDAEFTDSEADISVRAVADGIIVTRTWAKGYGGVVVIKHNIGGVPTFALYGHLDSASFLPAHITEVKAGDVIGILGDDHSQETDGTRKHLHFSLYRGEEIDYRGYVATKAELAPWLNPLDFF